MSYILDALRKSEQERLAGGVPGLHSPQAAPPETAASRYDWKVLAVILVVLNAGAIGWWLAARRGVPATPASSPSAIPPQRAAMPAQPQVPARSAPMASPAGSEGAVPPPAAPAAAEPPAPASAPQPSMAPPSAARAAIPPAPRPAPQIAPSAVVAHPPPAAPPVPEEAPAPAPPKGIVAFADLPASVRKALPPLQIGGYAEGSGSDAMLLVNDRLVSEGDEIGGGVRVLKISPDGAVFGFRGYRFRR